MASGQGMSSRLALEPGDTAYLRVEIFEHPADDMTHIRIVGRRLCVRLWVETHLIEPVPSDNG